MLATTSNLPALPSLVSPPSLALMGESLMESRNIIHKFDVLSPLVDTTTQNGAEVLRIAKRKIGSLRRECRAKAAVFRLMIHVEALGGLEAICHGSN